MKAEKGIKASSFIMSVLLVVLAAAVLILIAAPTQASASSSYSKFKEGWAMSDGTPAIAFTITSCSSKRVKGTGWLQKNGYEKDSFKFSGKIKSKKSTFTVKTKKGCKVKMKLTFKKSSNWKNRKVYVKIISVKKGSQSVRSAWKELKGYTRSKKGDRLFTDKQLRAIRMW